MNETILELLETRLREAQDYNANASVPPIALLWPDELGQWRPVLDRFDERLPILRLGDFDPDSRTGPAYWIRSVVAGVIDLGLPPGTPIVYLPRAGRADLRAVDSCPPQLAPIAELQYRSQWFSHPNGKDWTVRSFLANTERGLGLRVADDGDTSSALMLALDRLIDLQLDRASGQVLDADFFRDLVNPDPVRSLLGWLDDPMAFRQRLAEAQWAAFVEQCKADYGFNPLADGPVTAGRKLADRHGPWAEVWHWFSVMPQRYPGIPELLRQAKPDELFAEHADAWPQVNEEGEDLLRRLLVEFGALTSEGARNEAKRLDAEHAWRRATVWADLGLAPLAFAVEQLAAAAEVVVQPLDSTDLGSLVTDQADRGWRADDSVVRAIAAAVKPDDRAAACVAADGVYRSWLSESAVALQAAIGPLANENKYAAAGAVDLKRGAIALFVDGLRLDVAHRLVDRLVSAGLNVAVTTTLAALPTVTETVKPTVAPVGKGALTAGPELNAANAASGTKATAQVLRSLMSDAGVEVVSASETGDPSNKGWTEAGDIDHYGHDMGLKLVDFLDEEVERIASRIRELLDSGWQRVEVVTDHGWILSPKVMEKVELPFAATEKKKGRCARLKDGASVPVPTVPWVWNQDVRIALAPGATCFEANKTYEHGGVSPQECVVPRLSVTIGDVARPTGGPEITSVRWLGLLCRIELAAGGPGVIADIRSLPADATTSVAEESKEATGAGRLSLAVPDEEREGEKAYVVLVSPEGTVVAQREVTVGRNR